MKKKKWSITFKWQRPRVGKQTNPLSAFSLERIDATWMLQSANRETSIKDGCAVRVLECASSRQNWRITYLHSHREKTKYRNSFSPIAIPPHRSRPILHQPLVIVSPPGFFFDEPVNNKRQKVLKSSEMSNAKKSSSLWITKNRYLFLLLDWKRRRVGILLLLLLCPSRGISRRKGRRILFFSGGCAVVNKQRQSLDYASSSSSIDFTLMPVERKHCRLVPPSYWSNLINTGDYSRHFPSINNKDEVEDAAVALATAKAFSLFSWESLGRFVWDAQLCPRERGEMRFPPKSIGDGVINMQTGEMAPKVA